MIDWIEILTISVFSWLWASKLTQPEMIFSWVPVMVDSIVPNWATYPLYYCATCVCGFWYLLLFVVPHSVLYGFDWVLIQQWILAMGLTEMISRKFT